MYAGISEAVATKVMGIFVKAAERGLGNQTLTFFNGDLLDVMPDETIEEAVLMCLEKLGVDIGLTRSRL